MIRTKDLVEFIECTEDVFIGDNLDREYRAEIVARLRERDVLKKGIEDLIAKLCPESNVVDK